MTHVSNPPSPVPQKVVHVFSANVQETGTYKSILAVGVAKELQDLETKLFSRHFLVETTPPRDRDAWIAAVRKATTVDELKYISNAI